MCNYVKQFFFALVRTGFMIVAVDGYLDFSETHPMERLMYAIGVQLNSSLGYRLP
jgi:hypothetical protein